jgi:hypothetical protein
MLVLYNFLVGAAEPPQPQFKLSLMLDMKLYLSVHTNVPQLEPCFLFAEDELTFMSYSFALQTVYFHLSFACMFMGVEQ